MRRWRLPVLAVAAMASSWPGHASGQAPLPASQAVRADIAAHVREASQRFGIPEHWIYAVIRAESAGRLRAVSPAGAMGLMQLMPGTWARQRARFALGRDPFDPRDNILAGTSYLREMYDRYGRQGFLAAYNAGPGRYEDWLAGKGSLPLETRRYMQKVGLLLRQQPGHVSTVPAQLAIAANGSERAISDAPPAPRKTEGLRPSDNPFARPAQPAHDLFAPLSVAADR
jgi:soluble lytic murein transglycosylase-like protein